MIWTVDEYRQARRDITRRAREIDAKQAEVDRTCKGTPAQARAVVETHAFYRRLVRESDACERLLLALLVPPSHAVH